MMDNLDVVNKTLKLMKLRNLDYHLHVLPLAPEGSLLLHLDSRSRTYCPSIRVCRYVMFQKGKEQAVQCSQACA